MEPEDIALDDAVFFVSIFREGEKCKYIVGIQGRNKI